MALIIEDGSIVDNANSYVTLEEARTFLAQFGEKLQLLDSKAEADLVKAFFYMNTFENRYCGSRVSCDQAGAFPRNDLQINSCIIPLNSIPNAVKHAQIYAAYEESQGIALQSNSSGRSVVSESIDGCLSVTYSDNGQIEDKNILTRVQNALALLFGAGFGYTVSRG